MRGLDNLTPFSGGSDSVKLDELVELYKFPNNKWITLRLLPTQFLPIKTHWIKIKTNDGNETKIPRICIGFDPDNEQKPKKGIECPYCTLDHEKDGQAEQGKYYYANAIIRSLEKDKPRRVSKPTKSEIKTGLKDIDSDTWTPVRVVRLTNGTIASILEKGERNVAGKKTKKSYPLNHIKFGRDIDLRFNPKAPGAKKWAIESGDRTPLDADWALSSENKKGYAIWDLADDIVEKLGLETQDQANKNFARMKIVGMDRLQDDDEDEDEDDRPRKKKRSSKSDVALGSKKKKKTSKKKRSSDDDEDDAPKKKKKKKSSSDDAPKKKKKKRSSDEDDAPKKKKKKKSSDDDAPKKKKKKKRAF